MAMSPRPFEILLLCHAPKRRGRRTKQGLAIMYRQRLITILAIMLVWVPSLYSQTAKTRKKTIRLTVAVVSQAHLRKPVVDGPFCKRWLSKYLNSLDPAKMYFLSSDISEFSKFESKLEHFAKSGDTELLDLVTERYQKRAETALSDAIQRIDDPFDFSIKERMPLRNEGWAATESDRTERWRMQLKYDLLVEALNNKDKADRIKFLKTRYTSIREQICKLTEQEALGLYLKSFCQTADAHTGYITQKEFQSFFGGSKFRVYSTGLVFKQIDGRAIILSVAPGFRDQPNATRLAGYELMAIRSKAGSIYNLRENSLSKTIQLMESGLGKDNVVTLELFNEATMDRRSVAWPRREIQR